ncbi:hypothetical protein R50073_03850 [Maricurvus nonylphenolicus]|uniref:c-type cytochrome n=1 Tax=Maricurvus nonylphenolicus TaxID=1008307 RepID=UPI0036F212F8
MPSNSFCVVFKVAALVLLLSACSDQGQNKEVQSTMSDALVQGETLYKQNCKVCHAQGINGAPILGNKKMWGPRMTKGADALAANAVAGVGLMPAKGGKDHLSDAEIRLVVDYYLYKLQ